MEGRHRGRRGRRQHRLSRAARQRPGLADPAYDPYVIAVGGSTRWAPATVDDDVGRLVLAEPSVRRRARSPTSSLPARTSRACASRTPTSTRTTRRACSTSRYFRGSGTSAGGGDHVRRGRARPAEVPDADARPGQEVPHRTGDAARGLDVQARAAARSSSAGRSPSAPPSLRPRSSRTATGTGSLELARGQDHLTADGVVLNGEQDIFGHAFNSAAMAAAEARGSTWSGGIWNGSTWSGSTWSGSTWSGSTWSGSSWSGSSWSGSTWSGSTWSGSPGPGAHGPAVRGPAAPGPVTRGPAKRGASRARERRLEGAGRRCASETSLRVWLLIAAVGVGALVALRHEARRAVGHVPRAAAAVVGSRPGFFVAEAFPVHLHFRSETHSLSLSEVGIVLGLFLASSSALVLGLSSAPVVRSCWCAGSGPS